MTIFDNDSDPQAEAKTLAYLKTGVVPGAAAPTPPAPPDTTGPAPPSAAPPRGSTSDLQRRLDDLIRRQRELLKDTEDLRELLDRR